MGVESPSHIRSMRVQIPSNLEDRVEPLVHEYGYNSFAEFVRDAVRRRAETLEPDNKTYQNLHPVDIIDDGGGGQVATFDIDDIYPQQIDLDELLGQSDVDIDSLSGVQIDMQSLQE